MASGDTKTEAMLNVLGNGGSGDEFRGCCNTKTQQYILDAIDRINNLDPGGGGSGDIKKLTAADATFHGTDGVDYIPVWELETGIYTYNPSIGHYLLFDTTEDMEVGGYAHINNDGQEGILVVTNDGSYSVNYVFQNSVNLLFGSTGLPSADCISYGFAPKKLVSSLGEDWSAAISQGAVTSQLEMRAMNELTPEWYDRFYQEDPDNPVIRLWELNTGIYKLTEYTRLQINTTDSVIEPTETKLIILHNPYPGSSDAQAIIYDENMGTSSDPSSSAYGGQVIVTAYDGTKVKNTLILTEESGDGGGGVIELTASDYDYPANNPNGIAMWELDAGVYKVPRNTYYYLNSTDSRTYNDGQTLFIINNTKPNQWMEGIYLDWPTTSGSSPTQGGGLFVTGPNGQKQAVTRLSTMDVIFGYFFAGDNSLRRIKIGMDTTLYQAADGAIVIGNRAQGRGGNFVSVGNQAVCNQDQCVAIGGKTTTNSGIQGAVALGYGATATRAGEVNIGTTQGYGYSSTNYRVLGGVHDGQLTNDAVTVGQLNATIDAINTALGSSIPHVGA